MWLHNMITRVVVESNRLQKTCLWQYQVNPSIPHRMLNGDNSSSPGHASVATLATVYEVMPLLPTLTKNRWPTGRLLSQ